MFQRKLKALDFPSESIDIKDEDKFRQLIIWLEDEKIRHRAIEDRAALHNIESPDWPTEFQQIVPYQEMELRMFIFQIVFCFTAQYLQDLSCPLKEPDRAALTDWLLGQAVRLEYGDNVQRYKDAAVQLAAKSSAPQVVQANPLDNLDLCNKESGVAVQSSEFKAGVAQLAKLLNIQNHPDHLVTLKAVCTFVRKRLSPEALAAAAKEDNKNVKPYPLKENQLGFDTGDYVLNEAAKILRLLYVHDLRSLQTRINEAIVATQAITANPKTDTRLGKVGK
ncbi:C14orf166 [Cordylochernes scorpioides]|uniref:C14orf166 n=1 Tax=Cordylochernes scorpioides TaxID=51811 RepID=A0ABY6L2S4_9ARAC|nr:C14orf166 [Cordylochernes scorpioides]